MSQNPALQALRYIAKKAKKAKAAARRAGSVRRKSARPSRGTVMPRVVTAKDAYSRQPGREAKYEWISVKRILLKGDEKIDQKAVAGIAESIQVFGLLHPIAVRRITESEDDGEATAEKVVLVAGAHRLEAVKRLGRKKVPCLLVEGDDTHAQLVRLGENLWRKRTSVLRDAERLLEYLKLASVKLSGQPVRKSKFGRPPGGIALAARELPVIGRSVEARRQIIRRAEKIAQISKEAKKAAIKAGLQNNQQALLKIAKAGGQQAQLRMVAKLAEISKELRASRKRPANRSPAKSAANGNDATAQGKGKYRLARTTTTFDEMVSLWDTERRARWGYLPFEERERFIEMLRRAKRKARTDIVEFLKDVFRGRQKVRSRDLYGIAAKHGFGESKVRQTLTSLGYKRKRQGQNSAAEWFLINSDRRWERWLPAFTDADLRAAGDAEYPPGRFAAGTIGRDVNADETYYKDIG